MKTDFGDYYDNYEALQFAQRQIRAGRVQEGLELLRGLRNHIERTADTKSERYLLPNIDFYEKFATEHHALFSSLQARSTPLAPL